MNNNQKQELLDYYKNLLILQYNKKDGTPRATINTIANEILGALVVKEIEEGFNIDTAVGKQLDVIGKYIGLKRQVNVNIGTSDTNILNDEQYRILLKLRLVKNTNFSSTAQIREALYALFPNEVRLFDNRTMVYDYQLSTLFNDLVNVIIAEELLPLPMGIGYTPGIYYIGKVK